MTDDGGQVFPTMKKMGELEVSEGGMTVRQLYAGMVGARLAAQYAHNVPGVAERVAEDSFIVADAMIQVEKACGDCGGIDEGCLCAHDVDDAAMGEGPEDD